MSVAIESMGAIGRRYSVIDVVRESRPREAVKTENVTDARHTNVTYGEGRSNPFTAYFANGIMTNPDPVIWKFGGAEDVALYKSMWRAHPWLVGICDQRVERANRKRCIVAGDPSDARSVDIANAARRAWNRIPEQPTFTARWLKYARFLGYSGLEKVFARDEEGLIYPMKLIVRESENIKVRPDGTAVWLSNGKPSGDPIPPRKMSFLRGGTNDTFYGQSELQDVYPVTFWLESSVELMFDSIEEFGRPTPVLYMPRSTDVLSPAEREKIRKWARGYSRRFLEVPTDEARFRVEMQGANVSTSGAVGRPEMSIVELCITWAYIRILRAPQTLNKTGGSRALEEVRYDIGDDTARPDSRLLDDGLNASAILPTDYTGWMADFCDINFSGEPQEILPRFESPVQTLEEIATQHDMAMDLVDRGESPSKSWYYKTTGIEEARNDEDRFGESVTRIPKTEFDSLDTPNGGEGKGVRGRMAARRQGRLFQ